MKGFDVKALRQLETLKTHLEAFEDPDAVKRDLDSVLEMLTKYNERGGGRDRAGFFTDGERRRYIKPLYESYFYPSGMPRPDQWDDRDRRMKDELAGLLAKSEVPRCDRDFVTSILETLKTFRTGPTAPQRKALKNCLDRAKNFPNQKKLFDDLQARADNDTVFIDPATGNKVLGSMVFVSSVLSQFAVKEWWSELQQEAVENILNYNVKDEEWFKTVESLDADLELRRGDVPF